MPLDAAFKIHTHTHTARIRIISDFYFWSKESNVS